MREDFSYKAYLQYYRSRKLAKTIINSLITIFVYIVKSFIIIGVKVIQLFVIGCFLGFGGAFGFWFVSHWGLT